MGFVGLILLVVADIQTEMNVDLAKYKPEDAKHIRYFNLENVDNKDDYFAVVSFILNSISTSNTIVKPEFVNKDKTLIRFDLRDYKISLNNYAKIENDPLSKSPLMNVQWFIIKATITPNYYAVMGVSSLNDFHERHGHDPKKSLGEQAAVVISGKFTNNKRYLKRFPTLVGYLWEARSSETTDYLRSLLSEDYDSLQVLASNPNGLISYYIANDKGKPLNHISPKVAADTKTFEFDALVHASRNCMVCHSSGIISFEDSVRAILKKEVQIFSPDEKVSLKLKGLFGDELPIVRDQKNYAKAVLEATDMEAKTVMEKYVSIWKNYYSDLTFTQVANLMGKTEEELEKLCKTSGDVRLVSLFLKGKISRVYFEQITEGK